MIKRCKFLSVIASVFIVASSNITSYAVDKETTNRLNKEIYDIADGIINEEHLSKCFDLSSNLSKSAVKYYTPLIPIALTECETGSWADRSITWSSAVYSDLINIDWSNVSIYDIDESFYNVNMLNQYMGCGSNCTSKYHSSLAFGHTGIGRNDNDSLGSLQILRRYLQDSDGIKRYKCGAVVTDLMRWEDNVQFFIHEHGGRVLQCTTKNNKRYVNSTYELVALVAISHNTGSSFITSSTAGNSWNNSDAVFDFCSLFSNDLVISTLNSYVDEWFDSIEYSLQSNSDFDLLGQSSISKLDLILSDCGISLSDYSSNVTFKQYYPIRVVLNYMALERLYDTIK